MFTEEERKTALEIKSTLPYFSGTSAYHRVGFALLATDGVKYLAENAECFWILDIIDSALSVWGDEFARFRVKVGHKKDNRFAYISIDNGREGEDKAHYWHQDIPQTDLILEEILLFVSNKVVCLPTEY